PVSTADISTYNTVQIIRLAMMPIGMSRCGLRASSAVVDTTSKPMNAKNTIAAPLMRPGKPCGINGCQFVGFTMNATNAVTNTTTAVLMITIVVVVYELSRIP